MPLLKKVFILIMAGVIFFYIIYFSEAPSSWIEASIFQILSFFISLLILTTFLADIFLDYLPRSFLIGLGVVILFLLQALGKLNFLTAPLVLALVAVSVYYFKQPKLTAEEQDPALRLSNNPNGSKLSRFRRRRIRNV
jgi:hypothetical protein